ncbi:MAG TPA: NRDE family protein [Steroidobacteraceae bacterium]|nr:NRDE family protein [Steroidobacteraceae bacterium]
MCLILLVWRAHPDFPCVLAANRDEFHDRASAAADWWPGSAGILAGRDLQAGGTWLGVTRRGRFAALTNFRDGGARRADAPSRGALVSELLESGRSVESSVRHLQRVGGDYNPFNAIFSDGVRLGIYESARGEGRELGPGIFGLSNHLLDTPWPKVRNAKSALAAALADVQDDSAILRLLRDERRAPDAELPRTGASLEWERLLSSAFVRAEDYGTRCSTVLRIDAKGHAEFTEWTWDAAGTEAGRRHFGFDIEPAHAGSD